MPFKKGALSNQDEMEFTRIFLWRHPEVAAAKEGKFWGHTDVGLSKKGQKQIKEAVKRMAGEKLAAVYSSDLTRAAQMADAIARSQRPRRKNEQLKELRELSLGIWEGMTYTQIRRKYPRELEARARDLPNFSVQDGESLNDMAERVVPAMTEIVRANKGGDVCVVAHGGVNRVFLSAIMGAPLDRVFRIEQSYACLNIIDVYSDGTPVIKRVNETTDDDWGLI